MSKVEEAKRILKALGMPARQRNENATYTLLAMAGIGPRTRWADAKQPRLNPHEVIEFARDRHGKDYAENTRETIRRQAIHQFEQGGVLARNPDDPSLPTNSPRTHYAFTDEALRVVQAFGTGCFDSEAAAFVAAVGGGLAAKYARKSAGRSPRSAIRSGCSAASIGDRRERRFELRPGVGLVSRIPGALMTR